MKKHAFVIAGLLLSVYVMAASVAPKREFRATWFTTHYAIDWPRTYVKTTGNATQIAQQKKEMTDIMDALVAGHMNAFCFQARPTSDAFYPSSYEPWSKNLTGTRGKDPGWDPLAYAVQEGHKRGLEVHLWVNPYRVTTSGNVDPSDQIYQNCAPWLIKYDNGSFSGTIIDPGFPQARAYVIKVLMEMINNYDVDGILMDDYFYPYGGTTTEDIVSKTTYKPVGMTDGDWRRSNVDSTMKALYDTIQAVKPWVRFGMGPFGIWTTKSAVATQYGISLPAGITGLDDYTVQACNTVEWVKGGYVDYIAPQLYWATTSSGQDYDVLSKWWAQDVCKHFSDKLPGNKRVDFFVSQAAYRFDENEIGLEVDDNRRFNQLGGPGSIFYNTTTYIEDNGEGTLDMHLKMAKSHFATQALPPAMDWKTAPVLGAPTDLELNGTTLTWAHPSAERFTVYAYPKSMPVDVAMAQPQYLLGVRYGKDWNVASVPDFTNLAYAVCAYDRYGNEYTPAVLTDVEPTECNPYGWTCKADMFGDWALDYNDFYGIDTMWLDLDEYMATENPTRSLAAVTYNIGLMAEFMTTSPKWQWLANYLIRVTEADHEASVLYKEGSVVELLEADDRLWRFAVAAFFAEGWFQSWPGSADFRQAGQYAAFQSALGYTWCEESTALPAQPAQPAKPAQPAQPAKLLIKNGRLYIQREGKIYSLDGNVFTK